MEIDSEIVARHVGALTSDSDAAKVPRDVVGRLLIQAAIKIWQEERGWEDIANELRYVSENLDPDLDYEFMRP
jgi:hypothetical protein